MIRNRLTNITLVCILVAMASGCVNESHVSVADHMSLCVVDISSKATVTTTLSFEELYGDSGFMVYACGHDDPSMVVVDSKPFFKDDSYWSPATYILWPDFATDFFAWAPEDEDNIIFDATDKTISYTTPEDVSQQQDLLAATSFNVPALYNSPLPMTFVHALAAIKLVAGTDFPSGQITSISLCNVYMSGKYLFDTTEWTSLSGDGTIKLDLSASPVDVPDDNAGMPITKDDETFFVIPQTCSDDVHLELIYGGKSKYIYLPEGFVFHQGECVTLQVNGKGDWFYATAVRVEHREDDDAGSLSF